MSEALQTTCWVCLSCHLISTILFCRSSLKFDRPLICANLFFVAIVALTLAWSYHFSTFWLQTVAFYVWLIFAPV